MGAHHDPAVVALSVETTHPLRESPRNGPLRERLFRGAEPRQRPGQFHRCPATPGVLTRGADRFSHPNQPDPCPSHGPVTPAGAGRRPGARQRLILRRSRRPGARRAPGRRLLREINRCRAPGRRPGARHCATSGLGARAFPCRFFSTPTIKPPTLLEVP